MNQIGRYELQGELGAGGFGSVYRAYDPFMRRPVAVKLLTAVNDPTAVFRFRVEAGATGKLHHKNIVTVYDYGEHEGTPYLVMQLVEGSSLKDVIEKGPPLSVFEKTRILQQVAEGLQYAHHNAVIHRDIKPANIMLLPDGSVKILDFGIARLMQETTRQTKTGMIIGTVEYMAPELIQGKDANAGTDIWSFGVTAYELISHRHPFRAPQFGTVLYNILSVEPPRLDLLPGVPPELATTVATALIKSPAERFQSFQEVLLDLAPIELDLRKKEADRLADDVEKLADAGEIERAQAGLLDLLNLDPGHKRGQELRRRLQRSREFEALQARVGDAVRSAEALLEQKRFEQAIAELQGALKLTTSEWATTLREDVQRRLDAARDAWGAAQFEAERIREQERRRAEEHRRAEAARIAEEQRRAEAARMAEEQRRAEAARTAEEQRRAEAARIAEEQRRAEAARLAEEQRRVEAARIAEEQRRAEAARVAEEQRRVEAARLAEEQRRVEAVRIAEEQRRAEAARIAEEQRRAEAARMAEERRRAEQQGAENSVPQPASSTSVAQPNRRGLYVALACCAAAAIALIVIFAARPQPTSSRSAMVTQPSPVPQKPLTPPVVAPGPVEKAPIESSSTEPHAPPIVRPQKNPAVVPAAPSPAAAPPKPPPDPEEQDWKIVAQSREAASLRGFISKYPNSQHHSEAQQRLEELEWQAVNSKDPSALEAFARLYPDSPHAAAALADARRLQEQAQTAADQRAILQTLGEFSRAIEQKDAARLRTVWPTIPNSKLNEWEDVFKNARSARMELRPESPPQIEGPVATVACRSIVQKVFEGQGQVYTTEGVTRFTLRKQGSNWVIASVR